MLDLTLGELLTIASTIFAIPTTFMGICVWKLQRKIQKREEIEEARELAREENLNFIVKGTTAAIALAEATAQAVQRIPDAHCNGDMHAALDYAKSVKREHKDFLTKQGIHALYE